VPSSSLTLPRVGVVEPVRLQPLSGMSAINLYRLSLHRLSVASCCAQTSFFLLVLPFLLIGTILQKTATSLITSSQNIMMHRMPLMRTVEASDHLEIALLPFSESSLLPSFPLKIEISAFYVIHQFPTPALEPYPAATAPASFTAISPLQRTALAELSHKFSLSTLSLIYACVLVTLHSAWAFLSSGSRFYSCKATPKSATPVCLQRRACA
jgi:hypothetical protein